MGATEAYITLEEAARLEGVSYNTLKSRTRRGKLKTKNETRESGGKDIILVKVNSLSKQARNAYREQERLKALQQTAATSRKNRRKNSPGMWTQILTGTWNSTRNAFTKQWNLEM